MFDFAIESVASRGIPNMERVVIRVNYDTVTSNIGIMIGFRHTNNSVVPVDNRLLWFGSGAVKTGSIINVFTGHGDANSQDNGNGTKTYNLFWGLSHVAFDRPELEPVLFRLGEAVVGSGGSVPLLQSLGGQLAIPRQGDL